MKRISSLVISAALVMGIAGCVASPVEYSLTISSTEGGEIAGLGEGTFICEEGRVIQLVAVPASGYRFVRWTGDVGGIEDVEAPVINITVKRDYSIRAIFEPVEVQRCALTVSSTDGGSVTMPGEGTFTYDVGTVVNLVATPHSGQRFVRWTGDVGTVANIDAAATSIIMNGNYSIKANFEAVPRVRYSLTISSSAGGSVTAPGQGTFTYDEGTVVNLAAVPSTGHRFVNWTGDVGTIGDVNAASTTITMSGNYSIRANFTAIAPTGYILSISSSAGGSVTRPGEGMFLCGAGTVVSLVATPASGYRFVNWTGDVSTIADVNAASTTITMKGNYSIRANFVAVVTGQYSLTISSSAGGSVTTPGEGTFTYEAGTVVSLTAAPAAGYRFVRWMGDVGSIANVNAASTTVTMNGNYCLTAVFAAESSSPPGIGYTEAEAEALIIALINAQRQQYGRSALSEDALLASLAKEHSVSMAVNNFFSHDRYPGERGFTYGQLPGTMRGENIAKIPTRQYIPGPYLSLQQVCEWAVSLWMNSPGHRANILEPRYTRTGVGVAFSPAGDYLYITQMFEGLL